MHFTKMAHMPFDIREYAYFVLGGDIGGTNTNLGVFGVKNNFPALLLSFHFKSQDLRSLSQAANVVLNSLEHDYRIKIKKACFGVAGHLSHDNNFAKLTNVNWNASKKLLIGKTSLKSIMLINDFEAVGYGINLLGKNDVIIIKKAKKRKHFPILVIGAGTGLGKTSLVYSSHRKIYVPIPSEAGHSDFPAQSQFELDLASFIKRQKKAKSVSYEDVLSGRGLSRIYKFLGQTARFPPTKCAHEIEASDYSPEIISKYRHIDKTCKAVFRVFKIIYAKFARNFALDCLAYGGVYIAGGIAPKNQGIFDKEFVEIFKTNDKMRGILQRIPIYLITNHNVGLLGAGFACSRFLD